MTRRTLIAITVIALVGASCSKKPPVAAIDLFPVSATGVAQCKSGSPPTTPLAVPVEVLLGPGVDAETAIALTGAAASYYSPYGIELTASTVQRIAEPDLFEGSWSDLESLDSAAIEEALLSGLTTLLRGYSVPPSDGLVMVLVGEISDGDEAVTTLVGDIAGLGLSPLLAGRSARALTAVGEFTPTVVLATTTLQAMTDPGRTATVAHEIAHAFGLGHVDETGNLLDTDTVECMPVLDPTQLAAIVSNR